MALQKLQKKYILSLIFILCFVLELSNACYGGVIRVPLEYNTIQGAIDVAESGDTVKVDAGAYMEKITMKEGVDLIGSGAEYTSIYYATSKHVITGASNCTLKSFTISSGKTGSGINCQNISLMNISCNIIKNNKTYGIYCDGSNSPSLTICNNKITDCNTGISGAYSCVIRNNIISIIKYGGIGGSHCIISNNIINDCSVGFSANSGSNSILTNNIITNCREYGIKGYCPPFNACSAMPALFYNNLWNNNTNYGSNVSKGPSDISVDPLFIDSNNGDYNFSSNSPCRDAGSPEVSFNDPDGTRNDIGAYGGPSAINWKPITSGVPVVTQIVVTPNPVSKDGTITIKATGKIQY